jgi:hypothetical protein
MVVMCLPADAVTSHVNDTFVWLGIQLWRLAHVDRMVLICEECWIGQRWFELSHVRDPARSSRRERYRREV